VAKKEHAQIVSVLKSIEALPAGLYGMQILDRRGPDGKIQYDVEFVEHRLEDVVARLNRFKREDEKPFEAVQAVSEFNQRAYELFARPLVQAMSNDFTAKLGRTFHPLRAQRWAISDLNPWLWWLGPTAEAVRGRRQAGAAPAGDAGRAAGPDSPWLWWLRPLGLGGQASPGSDMAAGWARMMTEANPWLGWLRPLAAAGGQGTPGADPAAGWVQMITAHNPWLRWMGSLADAGRPPAPAADGEEPGRRIECMMSELTSAGLDYYRDMRDAMSEAAFFLIYGNLFSVYLADGRKADAGGPATASGDPRDVPYVREALASLEEGGYAEALARVGALINRGEERIPLSRLELRRDLAQEYAEFLPPVPREQMRRIRGEQDIIVRFEPERALAALPKLLADPADRERLVALVNRLLGDERLRARRLGAEDLARVDAVLAVLGAVPRRPPAKKLRTA
jgi:hypothetical protein